MVFGHRPGKLRAGIHKDRRPGVRIKTAAVGHQFRCKLNELPGQIGAAINEIIIEKMGIGRSREGRIAKGVGLVPGNSRWSRRCHSTNVHTTR